MSKSVLIQLSPGDENDHRCVKSFTFLSAKIKEYTNAPVLLLYGDFDIDMKYLYLKLKATPSLEDALGCIDKISQGMVLRSCYIDSCWYSTDKESKKKNLLTKSFLGAS